jgi:hypothetical protein
MAGFLGIPLRTYARLESGELPQGGTLALIAKNAGIEETALFQDPGTKPPEPLPLPKVTLREAMEVLQEFTSKVPPDVAGALAELPPDAAQWAMIRGLLEGRRRAGEPPAPPESPESAPPRGKAKSRSQR